MTVLPPDCSMTVEPSAFVKQLRAFARDCVTNGDMTPAAYRMLDRIIDDAVSRELLRWPAT